VSSLDTPERGKFSKKGGVWLGRNLGEFLRRQGKKTDLRFFRKRGGENDERKKVCRKKFNNQPQSQKRQACLRKGVREGEEKDVVSVIETPISK